MHSLSSGGGKRGKGERGEVGQGFYSMMYLDKYGMYGYEEERVSRKITLFGKNNVFGQ